MTPSRSAEKVVHVAHITRSGKVTLDGVETGTVEGTRRDYTARATDGSVVASPCDCKGTAISRLVSARLSLGDQYRITGLPSATGGPWTLA